MHDGTSARPGQRPLRRRLLPRDPPSDACAGEPAIREAHAVPGAESHAFPPVHADDLPADTVLTRLRALGLRITGAGPWQATCPVHADTTPSLSLTETTDGVLLVHCFGGCDTEEVLDRLDLEMRHLFPSRYALQFAKRRPRGALRFHGGGGEEVVIEPTEEECAEWAQLLKTWRVPDYALNQLAVQLGVPPESLAALPVGYHPEEIFWAFPERNDRGRIVGLVRRYPDGRKMAMADSMRGLTIPGYGRDLPPGPIYLPEGASDSAALHSVGVVAIGRPSAQTKGTARLWLVRLLRRHADREVIVVGDRDPTRVGARGARDLARYLQATLEQPVFWALPAKSWKDVREQIMARKWNNSLVLREVKR